MDLLTIGVFGIVLLLILLFLGMNTGFAMLTAGVAGFAIAVDPAAALGLLKSVPFNTTASFSLAVIPLFIMMGQFAVHGGLSADLYRACHVWLGRMPGGLAIATIAACGGFSAICGSAGNGRNNGNRGTRNGKVQVCREPVSEFSCSRRHPRNLIPQHRIHTVWNYR